MRLRIIIDMQAAVSDELTEREGFATLRLTDRILQAFTDDQMPPGYAEVAEKKKFILNFGFLSPPDENPLNNPAMVSRVISTFSAA